MADQKQGAIVALATACQESSLKDRWDGDADSVGLFQQRPSQGWGTITQLHDPSYATTKFLVRLQQVPGWRTLPVAEAAQAVQRSAFPDAYARWATPAEVLVSAFDG
ncbi:hypothetical protein ACIRCZ_18960 [Leifsonia sp. NPDC102414]|uniref:hypothetical protein n=1 Tax=Leifsonia sp. NPDC102414 TaxID=3364124 RepID=UPI00381AE220